MLHTIASLPAAGFGLAEGWNNLWGNFSSRFRMAVNFANMIGVALIAWGIFKYIWDRRRGGGGNVGGTLMFILAGLFLAGPDVILPALLKLVDQGGAFFVGFFK